MHTQETLCGFDLIDDQLFTDDLRRLVELSKLSCAIIKANECIYSKLRGMVFYNVHQGKKGVKYSLSVSAQHQYPLPGTAAECMHS